MTEEVPDDHYRITYDEIHLLIAATAKQIHTLFQPDVLIAIGGGGFYPARVLRTFLKRKAASGKMVNVPIQAIGLSLYEDLGEEEKNAKSSGPSSIGKIGTTVVRTQWLDAPKREGQDGQLAGGLLGKNILIVDEVDDSRTTLRYAYHELLSDVKKSLASLSAEERAKTPPTRFAVFVVNNKIRVKKGSLPITWSNHRKSEESQPQEMEVQKLSAGQENVSSRNDEMGSVVPGIWYFAAETTEDCWIE